MADLAERAARLAKADLVTGMVGEFPELQGLMGGYYAAAQGEDPQVAEAIRDHYKPVGQGDDVPTAPVTMAVSLADKLDTLVAFFYADMPPTGSKDPFALRRAALGVLELLTRNSLRLSLWEWITYGLRGMTDLHVSRGMPNEALEAHNKASGTVYKALPAFFADRLKVQQKEAGVRHDLIDAVFALGGEDDLVRLLARVHALQAFVTTDDGKNLLAGYKRAANILKKTPLPSGEEGARSAQPSGKVRAEPLGGYPHPSAASPLQSEVNPAPQGSGHAGGRTDLGLSPDGRGNEKSLSYTPQDEEYALIQALDSAEAKAAAAIGREDFEGAMAALASLRAPIDAFFEKVIVNDSDKDKRAARLSLLARMRDAVHKVADFSKIEG